ncbi:hypothetical protein [Embleya hyalina]|uniref:Peptidase n=1 Tax=Embleya hyalina TaxID=516124 RepID=A0A401YJB3_9ACTN|nr:peptidase [Embleya hyalina]
MIESDRHEIEATANSSEPHVYFQPMDAADPDVARGIPFTWRGLGVPANGELFAVPEPVGRANTP